MICCAHSSSSGLWWGAASFVPWSAVRSFLPELWIPAYSATRITAAWPRPLACGLQGEGCPLLSLSSLWMVLLWCLQEPSLTCRTPGRVGQPFSNHSDLQPAGHDRKQTRDPSVCGQNLRWRDSTTAGTLVWLRMAGTRGSRGERKVWFLPLIMSFPPDSLGSTPQDAGHPDGPTLTQPPGPVSADNPQMRRFLFFFSSSPHPLFLFIIFLNRRQSFPLGWNRTKCFVFLSGWQG